MSVLIKDMEMPKSCKSCDLLQDYDGDMYCPLNDYLNFGDIENVPDYVMIGCPLSAQSEQQWENCFNCPLSHGCPKIKGCTNEQAEQYASEIPDGCPLSTRPKIIRCEDCKHFQNGHICQHFSRFGTIEMKPDDFCSYAERREDG